jgi:endoglucanase
MDIELIRKLTEAAAIPGRERAEAELISELIKPYADKVKIDRLGSVIAHLRGSSAAGDDAKRIVLEAPMGSPGFLANDYRENGRICLVPVGFAETGAAVGAHIVFGGGAEGVIVSDEDNPGGFAAETGASAIDEAKELVAVGEWAVYKPYLSETGDGCLIGRPLSSSAACAALVTAAMRVSEPVNDVWLVFASQKTHFGSRGAGAALYSLGEDGDVDFALEIGGCPEIRSKKRTAGVLGNGAAIRISDGRVVCDPEISSGLEALAADAGIKTQRYMGTERMSDALAMGRAGYGVRTGGILVPVRSHHRPAEIVSLMDIEAVTALAAEVIRRGV